MVDLDDEHSWTTVVRRRSFKRRSPSQLGSCPSQSAAIPPNIASKASSLVPLKVEATAALPVDNRNEGTQDDDNEPRVLLRMKRAMVRVQESQFFRRLLDQAASPPVFDNLRRAAAPLSELELCSEECTEAKSVLTLDNQGEIEGESAYDSAGISFEFVEGKTLNSTHFTEFTKNEKPVAGISIENWQFQVVVYGLGKIADSEVSRCQLAVILLLKQKFSWIGEIEVYDPILSPSECRIIQSFGCSTVSINEEGRRSIEKPTVFYMPHCEDWLYDNVLQANWTPLKLRQLVILGNSFKNYQERWSSFIRTRSTAPPTYVLELQQFADEIPLEATSSLELPAFNNLSWHFFPGL